MESSNSLVSIIVPCYKQGKYLADCLRSVFNQTYTNWECIIVNDGSPDNTDEISKEWLGKDKRYKYLYKSNGGLSDARNYGLDIARGEYIMFLDSDDMIHPKCVELLLSNVGNSDIIFCDFIPFTEKIDFSSISDYTIESFSSSVLLGQIYSFRTSAIIVACCKLYKRSIWDGIRFPKGRLHEDEFIVHHIIDRCNTIKYLDLKLYGYRKHEGSIMATNSRKSLLDRLDAYVFRKQFFLNKGLISEAKSINDLIIPKLIFPSVPKDHNAWKTITTSDVLAMENISFKIKIIYLLKRYTYCIYFIGQRFDTLLRKS